MGAVEKVRVILECLIVLFLGAIGLAIVYSNWWYNLWGLDRWEIMKANGWTRIEGTWTGWVKTVGVKDNGRGEKA